MRSTLYRNPFIDSPGPRDEPEVRQSEWLEPTPAEPVSDNQDTPLRELTAIETTYRSAWVSMPELVIIQREKNGPGYGDERFLIKRPGLRSKPEWMTTQVVRADGRHFPEGTGHVFSGSIPVWMYMQIFRTF